MMITRTYICAYIIAESCQDVYTYLYLIFDTFTRILSPMVNIAAITCLGPPGRGVRLPSRTSEY